MIKEGDIIKFGKYPQGENGEVKPIEWLVLEVKPDEALLISRYGIECKHYLSNFQYCRSNWRDCTLREWLNNDFVGLAFSEEEEKKIKYSITEKNTHMKYATKDWNTVKDKVFCLDSTEVTWYFRDNYNNRRCKPTEYIIKKRRDKKILRGFLSGYSYWWLRSDTESIFATVVNTKGSISDKCLIHRMVCIRPALRLILNRGDL